MLKEIYLKNWKSFQNGQLYIDPLTILIGTNASGKSNILDALLFLQKIALGTEINDVLNGDSENSAIRGGADWAITKGSTEATIKAVVESEENENIEYHYNISFGLLEDNRIAIKSESLRSIKKHNGRGKSKSPKKLFYTSSKNINDPVIIVNYSSSAQGKIKRMDLRKSYSILNQSKAFPLLKEIKQGIDEVIRHLSRIFILDPIPSHMRNYSKLADKLKSDASNISGVLAALKTSKKDEIESILTGFLNKFPEKGINKVWAEPVGRLNTDAMLYCSEKWLPTSDELVVDARGMSDGTLRFLGIMTALLTIKEHSLLVIEEIDSGFHPSRAKLLVQFLKEIGAKRKIDVLCTTHNPAFLDALGNEMIVFISVVFRNARTGGSEIKLLEDISELPRLLARGRLGKLTTLGLIGASLRNG